MQIRPINAIDYYKAGHIFQYPVGTEVVYSNFTARSDRLAKLLPKNKGKVVFVGLQGFIQWFLIDAFNENFFGQPLDKVLRDYRRRMDQGLGEGTVTLDHITALYNLGYLPLKIYALPEGEVVDTKVPLFTVVNTLPEFFWLTNYIESVLSAENWQTITSATTAFQFRCMLEEAAIKTGSPLDFVLWQGHDFSFRGMGGVHAAANSGVGHLASFLGTDTVPALDYIDDYYGGLNTFGGGSVPATEHSVMCMGGKETEIETFDRLISEIYPSGVVSIVSDTWNFWGVVGKGGIAEQLKDKILARKDNPIGLSKVVFRPDSGNPVEILCGIKYAELDSQGELPYYYDLLDKNVEYIKLGDNNYKQIVWDYDPYDHDVCGYSLEETNLTENEVKGAVECLWDIFGGTITETGHKLLDRHVGLIYGDSITLERGQEILNRLSAKGFASANVVFGIGSYTYQYATRDTLGMAMKSTGGVVNGQWTEIFKDPVTDNGVKKSAKGWLRVEKTEKGYTLLDQQVPFSDQGELKLVFSDGVLVKETNIDEIRSRINANVKKYVEKA